MLLTNTRIISQVCDVKYIIYVYRHTGMGLVLPDEVVKINMKKLS